MYMYVYICMCVCVHSDKGSATTFVCETLSARYILCSYVYLLWQRILRISIYRPIDGSVDNV